MKIKFVLLACLALALYSLHAADAPPTEKADVVVYVGTPAGVMAAIAAAKHGHTVALVDINAHIGGVVSGGLVASDMGDIATHGGIWRTARRCEHGAEGAARHGGSPHDGLQLPRHRDLRHGESRALSLARAL